MSLCEDSGWEPRLGVCTGMADHPETELVELAKRVAVDTIWSLSGQRFGLCDVIVAPAPSLRRPTLAERAYGAAREAVCTAPAFITLEGPVNAVLEVVIDGNTVDDTEYMVRGDRLYRLGGRLWPSVQNMTVMNGEVGTWSVKYRRGIPVPEGGNYAAGIMACELFKSMTAQSCRLPQRVTEISREGISMTVLDPLDLFDKGRTGLTEVDTWLAAVNPHGLRAQPRVYSPDVPRHEVIG